MSRSIQFLVEGFLRPRHSYFDDKLDLIRLARLLREKHKGEGFGHSRKGVVHDDAIQIYLNMILDSLGPATMRELQEAMDEIYLVHPDDTERVVNALIASKELKSKKGMIAFPDDEKDPCAVVGETVDHH